MHFSAKLAKNFSLYIKRYLKHFTNTLQKLDFGSDLIEMKEDNIENSTSFRNESLYFVSEL